MITLGIHQSGITSSAALVRDDKIVAAAPEERFTRSKYQRGFPQLAVEYCLKEDGVTWHDIDYIAVGWNPAINLALRYQGKYSDRARFPGDWLYSIPNMILNNFDTGYIGPTFQEFNLGGKILKMCFVNHHDAHAAKAFLMSPFDSAAIFTADHYSEHVTTTWKTASIKSIDTIKEIYFPHSIGALYSAITEFLGYRAHKDEWKIMGLSAYGNYKKLLGKFEGLVNILPNGEYSLNLSFFNHFSFETKKLYSDKLIDLLGPPRKPENEITDIHCDIAAALQHLTEKIMFHSLNFLYEKTENRNLCISGGCIMNSVFNGKVADNLPFENVYVPFSPDDCGNSIGAALYVNWSIMKDQFNLNCSDGAFLGPSWSDEYIEKLLCDLQLPYKRVVDPAKAAAELLVDGNIIGWFQGRMEFGARALGNRSILADPRQNNMKDKINQAVKYRESFRPFAPAILAEKVSEYFVVPDGGSKVPFMEKVFQIKPEKRQEIPAVVHKDGSGRLQTVNYEDNPLFYRLIHEFNEMTGVPVVLNTSFNRKGEPIVCTPEDALRTYISCGLEAVIIHKFLLIK